MAEANLVELTNVCLRSGRGEQIFDNLNLVIASERSAMISGPAGSGKTSLVELLTGLRLPDSGSVEMFGRCISDGKKRWLKSTRRKIGGVGGIFGLVPTMTVAENVLFPLVLSGERPKLRRDRLFKILTEFSLLKLANEYPDRLTRVEYALTQFARAAIGSQPLIIVDEPAAGLDSRSLDWAFEYMIKLSASGRSMLILTSDSPIHEVPNADIYQIVNGALE